MIQIDLTSCHGDALSLIGEAKRFARKLDYSDDALNSLEREMMADDYDHLLDTFTKHFGQYVELVGRDEIH